MSCKVNVRVGHSLAAVFFDIGNDSLLELFVAKTAAWNRDYAAAKSQEPMP